MCNIDIIIESSVSSNDTICKYQLNWNTTWFLEWLLTGVPESKRVLQFRHCCTPSCYSIPSHCRWWAEYVPVLLGIWRTDTGVDGVTVHVHPSQLWTVVSNTIKTSAVHENELPFIVFVLNASSQPYVFWFIGKPLTPTRISPWCGTVVVELYRNRGSIQSSIDDGGLTPTIALPWANLRATTMANLARGPWCRFHGVVVGLNHNGCIFPLLQRTSLVHIWIRIHDARNTSVALCVIINVSFEATVNPRIVEDVTNRSTVPPADVIDVLPDEPWAVCCPWTVAASIPVIGPPQCKRSGDRPEHLFEPL